MKKELSIRLSLLGRVKLFVAGWADAYANLFSLYLGEKVSTGHVMRITHAVVAFMVLVFPHAVNVEIARAAVTAIVIIFLIIKTSFLFLPILLCLFVLFSLNATNLIVSL